MASDLVDIHPPLLKFIFELKKQSICSIQLTNRTEQFVAFKVKTTSPKKYCVKPNVGVIKPRGTSDFTVVMQAQNTPPPDLQCKDKFLVQSTVVPFGLTEENITPEMFVKDPSKHIEEKRMKVILSSLQKDKSAVPEDTLPLTPQDVDENQTTKVTDELRHSKDAESRNVEDRDDRSSAKIAEPRDSCKSGEEIVPATVTDTKLKNDPEELTLKLNDLASKLTEAEQTVVTLQEEKVRAKREKELIEQELTAARKRNVVKVLHKGYPFLYVFMVALIGLIFGYFMRQ